MEQLTERTITRIPVSMLESAREQWPEVKELSPGYVVRFAFALALTHDRNEALKATIDRRTTRHQERNINP